MRAAGVLLSLCALIATAGWATACSSSSSLGSPPPPSPCQDDGTYYCGGRCLNRTARCGPSDPCAASCRPHDTNAPSPTLHQVDVFYARLFAVGSPAREHSVWQLNLYHMFVRFRGFSYEHGQSYWYHELDANSPAYKYRPDGPESVFRMSDRGASSCTRAQVLRFRDEYIALHGDYDFFSNNCQHYANCLIETLLDNCRNLHITDCTDYTRAASTRLVEESRRTQSDAARRYSKYNLNLAAGAYKNGTNCLPIDSERCFCGCEAPKSSSAPHSFAVSRSLQMILLFIVSVVHFLGVCCIYS